MEELFEKLEKNCVQYPENQFPLAKTKDLLKNKYTLDGNKRFNYQEYLKNREKMISARKSVSISWNEGFVE